MSGSTHPTASPVVAMVVGIGLVLSGWYVASRGTGPTAQLGWILLAAGALSILLNAVVLLVLQRRR